MRLSSSNRAGIAVTVSAIFLLGRSSAMGTVMV
jgi:hypothetical protein